MALAALCAAAMPASASPSRRGARHTIHHHHRHAIHAYAGDYLGAPRYAPPAPIGVGLFGTGLLSEQSLFGFGF